MKDRQYNIFDILVIAETDFPANSGLRYFFTIDGLTKPGLEPTIYCTRGEHANHYATDVVDILREITYHTLVRNDMDVNKHETIQHYT